MKELGTAKQVNRTMCEAADTAAIHDPRMKAVYEAARRRHADRHGPAVVAVAGKTTPIHAAYLKT